MKINRNFGNLKESYLFATVADKTAAYKAANPKADIIRLGIGDVTRPLAPCVIEAGVKAVKEMGAAETFRGYGPYEGYDFITAAVRGYYQKMGVTLSEGEVFISDGAKSDAGNISELFDADNTVLIPDPVYPVYLDSNIMAGRKVIFADATAENGFLPMPDKNVKCDIIYICSPNNPTGAVYNKEQLKAWVDYANAVDAVILFDAAYEYFITEPNLPRSIYEIEGAKSCAIELCSLSKTAGFTGTRCGYTIVPKELKNLNAMWYRRQSTKFNGVSYVVQRMAEAVFSDIGQTQIKDAVEGYKKNAALIAQTLTRLNIYFTGGINSPYIWFACPGGDSWAFFDRLLSEANVVGTPGAGFGKNGEGFFRLTAFNNYENTAAAMTRFEKMIIG